MKYKSAHGSYSSRFFGYPIVIKVNRKSPDCCNYCDVKLMFSEDYEEGCHDIIRAISKNLFVKKEDIKIDTNDEGPEKYKSVISFKYVMPYISKYNTVSKSMSSDMASGIAACLFNQIIGYVDVKS